MSIIVNNTEVTDVVYNGTPLDTVIFNGVTVFEASSPVAMFNFTGIDANGTYQCEPGFNGVIVAYALGKALSKYNEYIQVTPTPTTASDYYGHYIFNPSTNKYEYLTSGTFPSYIEVGVTPCYDGTLLELDTLPTNTQTTKYVYEGAVRKTNNGFNSNYFNNFDFGTTYRTISEIPDLSIATIKFPSNYLNKPITKVVENAFVGVLDGNNGANLLLNDTDKFYTAVYKMNNCFLGKEILEIGRSSFVVVGRGNFTLNNKIQKIDAYGLAGVFSLKTNVIDLPSSITNIADGAFTYTTTSNASPIVQYKNLSNPPFAVSSQTIDCGREVTIFRRTVKNLSTATTSVSGRTLRSIIVFEHTQNDEITLDLSSLKNATEITIYTDCDAVKNYDWASKNYTVTFHPLSEYEGD